MLARMALLRFGVFELDEEAGELRRQGRLVRLTGQPLRALRLLANRPGEIVTRTELQRHIWDDRFVDFERNLNFCIAAVRDALGDSARSARFIETIPRRGYRFIADIVRVETADREPPTAAREPPAASCELPTANRQRTRRWFWAALVPILLVQAPPPVGVHTRLTTSSAALAAFERGLDEFSQGPQGRRRSISSFREATRLDPKFAEAYYALADVYLDLAGTRELPADAALSLARTEALRAVALEDVASTRTILGVVRLVHDWDWRGARREFLRSLAAQPGSDSTLAAYARYLSAAGEHLRAIDAIDRAEAIAPSCDLALWESAVIRYRAGRHDEALGKLRLAAAHGGTEWTQRTAWLALLIHLDRGDWTQASAAARGMGARVEATERAVLEFVRHAADRAAAIEGAERRPVWTAMLYAVAGDGDTAMTWLERAAAERDFDLVFDLRNPAFDAVRSDARYQRLAAAIGLPAEPRPSRPSRRG
jgi:DNA-binding winged helix-turn-helix (wHTH) protein/tetratricopeptide (TPR) repeat protein